MELRTSADGFGVWHGGDCLLSHTAASPCIWIGRGEGDFRMHRGNFDIHGAVLSRVALAHATVRDRRIELRQAPDPARHPGRPPRRHRLRRR